MSSSESSAFSVFGAWPQDGAMSNFLPDSKSSLSGLSDEVLFVSGFFRKRA